MSFWPESGPENPHAFSMGLFWRENFWPCFRLSVRLDHKQTYQFGTANHTESEYGGLAILGGVRWYPSRVGVNPPCFKLSCWLLASTAK